MKAFNRSSAFAAYAPLILWIGVIFYLSSEQGSMAQTSRFVRPLLVFLFPAAPEETLQLYHGYVRKGAHFTEYAVLAFLAIRAFSTATSGVFRNRRYLLALGLVVAVATIDEFNQSFEISRTGSGQDVMLDILGGVAMVIFLWIIKRPRLVASAETQEGPSSG